MRTSLAALFVASALVAGACSKEPPKDEAPPSTTPSAAAPSASAAPSVSAAPSSSVAAAAASVDPSASASAAPSAKPTTTATAAASAKPAASASGPPDGAGVCGTKPLPNCPLQAWMKANTAPAMAANDSPALSTAFKKIQTFAPPGYTNWASIAKDGASAADAGNIDAVKAACRGCHDQYKAKYKSEMRTRPVS